MLTMAPTEEMIAEWKRIFEMYHSSLMPNRKSGDEVDRYFREKYPHQKFDNAEFRKIVSQNITENDCFSSKLPQNTLPNIQSYKTGNVLVGIDLCTGEFHVESENIEEVIPIHDDLFAYRGLDAEDINNFFFSCRVCKTHSKVNSNLSNQIFQLLSP